jgi:hypothetical protein
VDASPIADSLRDAAVSPLGCREKIGAAAGTPPLQHDNALPEAGAIVTRIPPRILVAEGEPNIRMMIVDTLKEAG